MGQFQSNLGWKSTFRQMMMLWGLSAVFVCLATPTRSQLIAGADSPGGMFGNLSCGTRPVVMQTRGGAKNNIELWPNGVVQYIIESSFTAVDRAVFQKSIDLIEANTCVRFSELSQPPPSGSPYMRLERECNCRDTGGDCFGGGYTDGTGVASPRKLVMSAACLSEDSAANLAFMTHEVFHALGVVHTQSRPDRDVHITVNTDNILSRWLSQYDKCSQCLTHGTIYDCNSIMHYRDTAFQKPGHGPTMTAKRDDCNLHTYPSEVTTSDWNLIKAMYNCKGCNGDNDDWFCCNVFNNNKCNIGEGDCDNDNDCMDGLMNRLVVCQSECSDLIIDF